MTWESFRNIYNKEPSDFELQLATTIEQQEKKLKGLADRLINAADDYESFLKIIDELQGNDAARKERE